VYKRQTLAAWKEVKEKEVPRLNERLRGANLPQINFEEAGPPN